MHVSVVSVIFMALSAIISIGLPILLFILFRKKYNAKFIPMITGAAAFIVFALVLEQFVHFFVFKYFPLREKPLLYIIYGIFMAGIFEETARFISFKILKKKYNGIITGLSYGIGHGGTESVLIGGVSMISCIVLSILLNTGNIETITKILRGPEISSQINTIVTSAPYLFLTSSIERTFALGIQIALSVIMFYSVFCPDKLLLYPLAVLLHAIIDIPAAMYQVGVLKNILLVEGIVFFCTVLMILFALNVHKKLKNGLTRFPMQS